MESDREIVAAWTAEHIELCSECHTRRAEWDPKQGGNSLAYVAGVDRCPGCETLQVEMEAQREQPGSTHGIKFFLKRPEPAENMIRPKQ